MEEQKKVNPLATEKEGKLIAKFAIPAIISMLVSSLYNIVDQIFIGQERLSIRFWIHYLSSDSTGESKVLHGRR